MAYNRISGNDVHSVAPSVSKTGLGYRQRNSILGEAASKMSSQPTVSRNDRRNVSYGAAPSCRSSRSGGSPCRSQVDLVGPAASVPHQSAQKKKKKRNDSAQARTAAPRTRDIVGAIATQSAQARTAAPRTQDIVGAIATRSAQARTAAPRTQDIVGATASAPAQRIQGRTAAPRTQSNAANTTRTPVRIKHVTPKIGSSKVTVSPSYQNHYQQKSYSNYYNDDGTAPMGVAEATIDLLSNAGSSAWTLGKELFQGKST